MPAVGKSISKMFVGFTPGWQTRLVWLVFSGTNALVGIGLPAEITAVSPG